MLLGYCTNIHPAETWDETFSALNTHVLAVRDRLIANQDHDPNTPYPIGLRLSALAATELLAGNELEKFSEWLQQENCRIFTINGFPYGSFHGTRVKEKVFLPDWTDPERLTYTKHLFEIGARIPSIGESFSVSTLPGSHKTFLADETQIFAALDDLASFLEDLSKRSGVDLHLGMEPEPLGHFENTEETIQFFERLCTFSKNPDQIAKRIGVNFDTCHFAIEFDEARESLDKLRKAGIRLSKIHLSNALSIDPSDPMAIAAIRKFEEPTYFHQVITKDLNGSLNRFIDLPDFLDVYEKSGFSGAKEARIHFHIPLDAETSPPLSATSSHVTETLRWCQENPEACDHFEIETYTWAVLPAELQRPLEEQIAAEYRWVYEKLSEKEE